MGRLRGGGAGHVQARCRCPRPRRGAFRVQDPEQGSSLADDLGRHPGPRDRVRGLDRDSRSPAAEHRVPARERQLCRGAAGDPHGSARGRSHPPLDRSRADLRGHRRAWSRRINKTELSTPCLTVVVKRTIRGIPRADWDSCFPGDPEGWAYYCAVEESGLSALSWLYFVARERHRVLAVVPAFITDYRLATTIQGNLKVTLQPLLRNLGKRLTLRML